MYLQDFEYWLCDTIDIQGKSNNLVIESIYSVSIVFKYIHEDTLDTVELKITLER